MPDTCFHSADLLGWGVSDPGSLLAAGDLNGNTYLAASRLTVVGMGRPG